ncbi:MAG: hypothetical protein KDB33_00645 [Acidimicrobiales bacterium]|nr:hypothetical protein [Acidimicrobiales bacterium]MCB8957529.1 hypothetical protein [Nocardioides sp.]
MRIAIAAAAAAATLLAAGCASPGTTTSSDCMSHYVHVADAPSRAALLQELREDVDPRVQDLRVIDDGSREGKVTVNLLSGKDRTLMSLDMWQRDDGTWTADRWSQCID